MTNTRKNRDFFRKVWGNVWRKRDANNCQIDFLDMIKVDPEEDIVQWAESNWDLSYDETSRCKGLIRLYTWQKQVLQEYARPEVRQVVIMGPSRTAKTTLISICMAWTLRFQGHPCGLMLENLDKTISHVRQSMTPILAHIPHFSRWLSPAEAKRRFRNGCLRLPLGSIRSFGSGMPATQFTLGAAYADEIDRHKTQSEQELPACESMAIRTETYLDSRKIIFASTPGDQDTIGKHYYGGSQGRWHIACLSCGHLWSSSVIGYLEPETGKPCGLQWSKTDKGDIKRDSIRWHCPVCGHVATESEAVEMNNRGRFVHLHPDRPVRSFHIGCLGLPYLDKGRWENIAAMQEKSGKGSSLENRKYWQIEYLGLPFRAEVKSKAEDRLGILKSKCLHFPKDINPAVMVAGVDVQSEDAKKYYKAVVVAVTDDGHSYQVEARKLEGIPELERFLDSEFCGRRLDLALVDCRGFSNQSLNSDLMPVIARRLPIVIGWQGMAANTTAATSYGWTKHPTNRAILQFVDQRWQANALDALYIADGSEKLMLSPDNPDEFFSELIAMSPPKSDETAAFEKWRKGESESRNDYFDALKMAMTCKELVCQIEFFREFTSHSPAKKWTKAMPSFMRRRIEEQIARQKR